MSRFAAQIASGTERVTDRTTTHTSHARDSDSNSFRTDVTVQTLNPLILLGGSVGLP